MAPLKLMVSPPSIKLSLSVLLISSVMKDKESSSMATTIELVSSLKVIMVLSLKINSVKATKIDHKTGYICDFKELEAPLKEIVETLKGKMIVPTLSKSLTVTENDDKTVTLV